MSSVVIPAFPIAISAVWRMALISALENLPALHRQCGQMLIRILQGDRTGGSSSGDVQYFGLFAIGSQMGRKDAAGSVTFILWGEDGGSSSIAKEDTGVAIRPIDKSTEFFGTDDEGILEGSTSNGNTSKFKGI